ncbi:hypothetical protein BCR44DRAFT_95425, partial [Catenaria anguillulae PL171]
MLPNTRSPGIISIRDAPNVSPTAYNMDSDSERSHDGQVPHPSPDTNDQPVQPLPTAYSPPIHQPVRTGAQLITRIVDTVASLNLQFPGYNFSVRPDGGLIIVSLHNGSRVTSCPHPACITTFSNRRSNCVARHFATEHAPNTLPFVCSGTCRSKTNRRDHFLSHLKRNKARCAAQVLIGALENDTQVMMSLVYPASSEPSWPRALVRDAGAALLDSQLRRQGYSLDSVLACIESGIPPAPVTQSAQSFLVPTGAMTSVAHGSASMPSQAIVNASPSSPGPTIRELLFPSAHHSPTTSEADHGLSRARSVHFPRPPPPTAASTESTPFQHVHTETQGRYRAVSVVTPTPAGASTPMYPLPTYQPTMTTSPYPGYTNAQYHSHPPGGFPPTTTRVWAPVDTSNVFAPPSPIRPYARMPSPARMPTSLLPAATRPYPPPQAISRPTNATKPGQADLPVSEPHSHDWLHPDRSSHANKQ